MPSCVRGGGDGMTDQNPITFALERAGEVGGDITPLVYARLFAAHPEMEALFVRDTDGSVRGEMLMRVFEAILDFIDRRAYAALMIQCEVVTHEGYGVPPEAVSYTHLALQIINVLIQ